VFGFLGARDLPPVSEAAMDELAAKLSAHLAE